MFQKFSKGNRKFLKNFLKNRNYLFLLFKIYDDNQDNFL